MRNFYWIVSGIILLQLGVVGCASVQPWEREYLSDEIMQFEPDELEAAWLLHVQEVLEGARGGYGGAGGGCGCR